jgi:hypothetical protein
MRAAFLLALAVTMLPACSSRERKRDGAIDTILRQLSAQYRAKDLCLHHSLVERRPATTIAGIYLEQIPRGFEALDVRLSRGDGPLQHQEIQRRLPPGWHIGDGAREFCLELTIPVLKDERAVISVQPANMTMQYERASYWLHRAKGRWGIAAVTEGGPDI